MFRLFISILCLAFRLSCILLLIGLMTLFSTQIVALPRCSVSGFTPARNYNTSGFPYTIVIGDFNDDNRPDLAVTNVDFTGGVSVLSKWKKVL